MEPDQVLEEHGRLRGLLREVLDHAERARGGDASAALELSRRVSELCTALRRHTIAEEEEAGPLIEALDAWGAERRQKLTEAHAQEEDAAARLRTATDVDQIVQRVADIVAALRLEERELLTDETLKPDTVVTNQSDG